MDTESGGKDVGGGERRHDDDDDSAPRSRARAPAPPAHAPMVKSILNSAPYKHLVKRLVEKTLDYYVQECLSVQDVKMIL